MVSREWERVRKICLLDAQFHINFQLYRVTFSATHLEFSKRPREKIPKNCRTTKHPPVCTLSLKLCTQNDSHFRGVSQNTWKKWMPLCVCVPYGKKIALIYATRHILFRGSETNFSSVSLAHRWHTFTHFDGTKYKSHKFNFKIWIAMLMNGICARACNRPRQIYINSSIWLKSSIEWIPHSVGAIF